MSEYWEPIHGRGLSTGAVWQEHNLDFMVGTLTLTAHQDDVALFGSRARARDEAEGLYHQAVDARDVNWKFLHDLNVAALRVIRGNLDADDLLVAELDEVNRMRNEGSGKILARARRLSALWLKVNGARAAATPPLGELLVGASPVGAVDAALDANEPLLKAVAQRQSAWTTARRELRKLADRVDRNNKRWFEAWSGNYARGTVEHEALSQIDTGAKAVPPPGPVKFTATHDAASHEIRIEAQADHATHFRELRQGPGEDHFIERASNQKSPLRDVVVLPGVYKIKLQARNSSGDGPVSAEVSVTVSGSG